MMKTWKKFAIAAPPILLATATIVLPVFIAQKDADYRASLTTRLINQDDLKRQETREKKNIEEWNSVIDDPKATEEAKTEAYAKLEELDERYFAYPGRPEYMLDIMTIAYEKKDYIKLGNIERDFKEIVVQSDSGLQPGLKVTNKEVLWIYPVYLETLEAIKELKKDPENKIFLFDYMLDEYIKSIKIVMKSLGENEHHTHGGMTKAKFDDLKKYLFDRIEGISKSGSTDSEDIRMAKKWSKLLKTK